MDLYNIYYVCVKGSGDHAIISARDAEEAKKRFRMMIGSSLDVLVDNLEFFSRSDSTKEIEFEVSDSRYKADGEVVLYSMIEDTRAREKQNS